MLAGHLLFINGPELIIALILYSLIGVILLKIHPFLINSNSKLRDITFYILFGLVVTSSVKMVGLLLVFSFLVLPLLSIILFAHTLSLQLKLAWTLGIFASLTGLLLSFVLDIPPSFSVILVLIGCFLVSVCLTFWFKKNKPLS